ncbi:DUF29 domain-containing protein [Sulfurihydrogenibium sp.]|jgi:dGTP triphosphohydrolase|uniref:DUF29 domain-containing protein n=1 Tax=Sulfurihydrogenibium sp. TaxID=2053621 RepID=UPI002611C4AC|nr:DUF29 domain-containing protein [Sulfurihydrogenibium sp.]
MATQSVSKGFLKELYEKDYYRWVNENLQLLKEKKYDSVDWENLLEEIEDLGRKHLESVISYMAIILQHLYKIDNFKIYEYSGKSWINSVLHARKSLEKLFLEYPSLKQKAVENIEKAWKRAVIDLVYWFQRPENEELAKKFFGRLPTEKDFPEKCPYTYKQIFEYKPWIKEDY